MIQNFAAIVNSCTTGLDGIEQCTQTEVSNGGLLAATAIIWIIISAIIMLIVVSQWKIFVKAGKPGWASLIPIYNTVVELQIIGKPDWYVLLLFVPFVNIVITIMICIELAKVFGKSALFGFFGLGIFSIIGYPILAFGKAKYLGIPNDNNQNSSIEQNQNVPPTNPTPQIPVS